MAHRRILVTGVAGFIGVFLVKLLLGTTDKPRCGGTRQIGERSSSLCVETIRVDFDCIEKESLSYDRALVFGTTRSILDDPQGYEVMSHASNPCGDGHASERIAAVLVRGE